MPCVPVSVGVGVFVGGVLYGIVVVIVGIFVGGVPVTVGVGIGVTLDVFVGVAVDVSVGVALSVKVGGLTGRRGTYNSCLG
jgi:hypothetical protein